VFLVRYFLYAGGALLALLFLVDRYSPVVPATVAGNDQTQETALDKEILRIQSAQKWPQKIVFDTDMPTIVPPAALVVNAPLPPTAEAVDKSLLDARAEARSAVKAATPPRKVARHRTNKPFPPQAGAYPVASAWTPWW
jgi:hypothetical protein